MMLIDIADRHNGMLEFLARAVLIRVFPESFPSRNGRGFDIGRMSPFWFS